MVCVAWGQDAAPLHACPVYGAESMRLLLLLFVACVCCLASAYGQTQTPGVVIPKERIAETPALSVVVERLQYLGTQEVIFHLAFTNKTGKDVLVITGYPQADKVIATDASGQLYRLKRSIGMERIQPDSWAPETWGTFLTLPAGFPTRATFLFTTAAAATPGTPMTFSGEFKLITDIKQRTYTTTTITFLGVTPE